MTKVVSTSLILIALCGFAPHLHAQQESAAAAAQRAAAEESLRRQAMAIELRSTLREADLLKEKGDIVAASKKYEEAYELVQKIGVAIDVEKEQTIAGMTAVRMEIARKAQARGDLAEAEAQVSRVLRINPTDEEAQKFKADNDKRIADRAGKEPSRQALEQVAEVRKDRINTSILVQDARLLMEMGKLDEAEAKLRQAVKEDPEHRGAFYYLTLIQERRYSQEARKREVFAKEAIVEVEREWNEQAPRDLLPTPNPYARTNLVYTSPGRQAIARKLDKIVIDEWFVPGDVPLSEVIKELDTEAKKRDPDRRGLNFIISSQLDRAAPSPFAAAGAFGPQIDPLTGQPLPPAAPEAPLIVEEFTIKIDPPLKNVRLLDVLDAIVKVAKPPQGANQAASIKYSIEDYAIVFTQRPAEADPLYTRTFKVDPNTFVQGLDGIFFTPNPFQGLPVGGGGAGGAVGGGGGGFGGGQTAGTTAGGVGAGGMFSFSGSIPGQQGGIGGGGGVGGGQTAGGGGIIGVTMTNSMSTLQDTVRAFFTAAGVDFQTNQNQFAGGGQFGQPGQPLPPQKAIFFNDRTGVLFVRATLRDLDIIEGALAALNVTPPVVTIEAKFAEISQTDSKGMGFDWFLGNTLISNGKMGFQGGTAPSYNDTASPANPYGVFPGSGGIPSNLPNPETDGLITGGLNRNPSIPAIGTFTGILTDPQFRAVIRAMEARENVDLLSAPKITTVSGRQARISVEDTQTIITGLQVQGLGGGGAGVVGGGGIGGGIGVPGGFTAPIAP